MAKKLRGAKRGRKAESDPKDTIVLLVKRSAIIGEDNLDMEIKDAKGNWNVEYIKRVDELKQKLYEAIIVMNKNDIFSEKTI